MSQFILQAPPQSGPKHSLPVVQSTRNLRPGDAATVNGYPANNPIGPAAAPTTGPASAPVVVAQDGPAAPPHPANGTNRAAAIAALQGLGHLPGSASRLSVDFPGAQQLLYSTQSPATNTGGAAPVRHSLPVIPGNSSAAQPPRPSLPPMALASFGSHISGGGVAAAANAGAGAVEPAMEAANREMAEYNRRRNMRASVDAAAGAELLATRQASAASVDLRAAMHQGLRGGGGGRGAQEEGSASEIQAGQHAGSGFAMPRFSISAPSSPKHHPDWSFGGNLQRARMKARYAAMDAADEILYENMRDGGGSGDGSVRGGGGGASWLPGPKRAKSHSTSGVAGDAKQRKGWKLFGGLFGGGGGGKGNGKAAAAAAARAAQRGGGGTSKSSRHALGDSDDDGHDAFGGGEEEDDEPLPVQLSRDSRLVHRTRLGLDGRPHTLHALLGSTDSADTQQGHDDVDAAVAAAAAAFATAVSAVSVSGPTGTTAAAAAEAEQLPLPRRVHFRRPPVVAVHVTKGSDEFSESSDKSSNFTFIGRLRSQLLSLSGSLGSKQPPAPPMPHSAQLYRLKAAPTPPPPPVHSNSAPLLKVGIGGAGGGSARPSPSTSINGGPGSGLLSEFRRSFRAKGVVPVAGERR